MKICSIVGIRPQYIKMGILMRKIDIDPDFEQIIINTGQHYDYEMAQEFFEELKIPDTNYDLEVGSGTHAEQTAKMLVGIEKILKEEKPKITLVAGDGNPTLAGALASVKIHIYVGHIEAGLRSYNWGMAEEINRVLVDHCSSYLFAPTENAVKNLLNEGIKKDKIFFTGDVTVDLINENIKMAEKSSLIKKFNLKKKNFILVTLHRAENVDKKDKLKKILSAISKFDNVIFPIHPRTRTRIKEFGLEKLVNNIILTEPLGYIDFLNLLKNSSVVITDSGGVQKEAFLVGTPCMTVRDETEWIETVERGANVLVGTNVHKIIDNINLMKKKKISRKNNPFGHGNASEKILKIIKTKIR